MELQTNISAESRFVEYIPRFLRNGNCLKSCWERNKPIIADPLRGERRWELIGKSIVQGQYTLVEKRDVYPSNAWFITVTAFKSVGLLRNNYFKISSNASSNSLGLDIFGLKQTWNKRNSFLNSIHNLYLRDKNRPILFLSRKSSVVS